VDFSLVASDDGGFGAIYETAVQSKCLINS
jgi:hypothetical protein